MIALFSFCPQVYFQLNDHDNRQDIINAMSLPYFSAGTTNTAAALSTMREEMFTGGNGQFHAVLVNIY